MEMVLTASANLRKEYSCEIVRISQVTPIEGSDFLGKTEIHPGMPIVVRKDMVKEGDIMFYVDMESQLCDEFLRVNNQYQHSEMNEDPEQKGFFDKNGRVKLVRLRGQESMGYLFSKESMVKFCDKVQDIDLEQHIGLVFDTVDGKLLVCPYVPKTTQPKGQGTKTNKRDKVLKKFDRIIPGTFAFHYDTDQLEKNIRNLSPDDTISISTKLHGTSAIFANIPVRKKLNLWQKFVNLFTDYYPTEEYDNVYSSRKVIQNKYINPKKGEGYYNEDVWAYWHNIIKAHIPKNFTIYGEIVGFTPQGSPVQKEFDYGCVPGESKLMIYRIVEEKDGVKRELEIPEVVDYTKRLINLVENFGGEYAGLARNIILIDVLYHGRMGDLYELDETDANWHSNWIHMLSNDKSFYMEKNEPLCKNKVPREGVVVRKFQDPVKRAYKFKTMAYRNKEKKMVDAGEVDIEMEQSY
jgi:hypothetical protein